MWIAKIKFKNKFGAPPHLWIHILFVVMESAYRKLFSNGKFNLFLFCSQSLKLITYWISLEYFRFGWKAPYFFPSHVRKWKSCDQQKNTTRKINVGLQFYLERIFFSFENTRRRTHSWLSEKCFSTKDVVFILEKSSLLFFSQWGEKRNKLASLSCFSVQLFLKINRVLFFSCILAHLRESNIIISDNEADHCELMMMWVSFILNGFVPFERKTFFVCLLR